MRNKVKISQIYFLFLVCFFVFNVPITAQNQTDYKTLKIQEKYNYYRLKLKNDFLVIGDNQGESLPIVIRNKWGGDAAAWGDATIHLGWYLGVLGTENYILSNKKNDKGLTDNYKELYFAMLALQRLDNIAESHKNSLRNASANSFFVEYLPQNLVNGYFTRDDVPKNFVEKHSSLLNNPTTAEKQVAQTQSDWDNNDPNHEMSKDQVVHLLMGLRLIRKYLPNQVVQVKLKNATVNVNFSNWAEFLSIQMLNQTISNKKIINPVTEKLVKRGNLTNDIIFPLKVLRSEYLGENPKGFNKVKFKFKKYFNVDYLIWVGYKRMAQMKTDNLHMVMTLGGTIPTTITRKTIIKKASIQNWHPFYELLYDAIEDKNNGNYSLAFKFLVDAPNYGLNHNMPDIKNKNEMNPGWESPHRFMKNAKSQNVGWNPSSAAPEEKMNGYFNGLDFMLLHNLYAIKMELKN